MPDVRRLDGQRGQQLQRIEPVPVTLVRPAACTGVSAENTRSNLPRSAACTHST